MVPGCSVLAGIIILKANKEENSAWTRSLINHQLFATSPCETQKLNGERLDAQPTRIMAAAATRMVKPSCESSVSPKTPSNTTLVETAPLHITPLDAVDSERDPDTPHKESTYKKKSGKLVSKRKLFLQSGQSLHISKAKRHASPKIPNAATPTSRPVDGSRPFPLTERQQLQYLLEVTAKEAQQDSESSSNDDLSVNTNRAAKKDAAKDNQIESRIRKRNERGETALHVAAIRGDLEDVAALIKAGALVNAKDNAGWTPLHEACNFGNLSIVQELVWSGADVNSPGYEAITPLHDAVINDHIKVVKFLLENGADPKLQTSQSYSASDLARSEAVLTVLNPDEKSREFYPVEAHESQPNAAEYRHPNHYNLPEAKVNGLNTSYMERSSYDNRIDQVEDPKNSFPQGFSFKGVQNDKVFVHPQENFGVNGSNHNDKQEFCVQRFPAVYGFPGNAYQFSNETEVGKEREEAFGARLLPKDIVENNNKVQVKQGYGACQFQEPHCNSVASEESQSNRNTEVVNSINGAVSSEEHIDDINADSTSEPTYLNGLGGASAEDLDQMYARNLFAKKPGLTVTSESEEDTVRPEKLNECLDKAMIEISSYLGTSQNVDMQVPCDSTDIDKCSTSQLINGKPQFDNTSKELVDAGSLQRPEPMEIPSDVYNSEEDHPSLDSSLLKKMECKEDRVKVFAEEANVDAMNCTEQQPQVIFTRIKTRSSSEKKKDSGVSERSGKSGRRKRSSTRSSESKTENNQGLRKEECMSHIRNISWRKDLPKYRYSMSSIPVCVPGYDDFLINSKNSSSGEKSLSNEIIKDTGCENELDRLISQHNTEKVKLRMSFEQELVRLFGNCARKSAGYQVPYSACSIISSQMGAPRIKQISAEKEQPISIRLEVEKILCKFNKLKTEMLKRHKREIEVVLAMESFWQQNEGLNGPRSSSIKSCKNFCEDFDLLPAKFNDYYEEVLCATD